MQCSYYAHERSALVYIGWLLLLLFQRPIGRNSEYAAMSARLYSYSGKHRTVVLHALYQHPLHLVRRLVSKR